MTALPPQKIYISFEPGPYRMAMGLVARDPDELIEIDEHFVEELAEKRDLLATRHDEVYAAIPGTEAACAEVLSHLAAFLPRRFPDWFTRDGALLTNRLTGETWDIDNPARPPLELASRLVQEDLCLVRPDPEGPILAAASLCFPSRWRLQEKIGHPLAHVHTKVPFYGERLAAPVDRFMQMLRAGKMVERLNWSMMDDPALFQPGGKWRRETVPDITVQNAGEKLWLRVERQTLMRLPDSGFVLFGIRLYVYPLTRIAADRATAARLGEAVRALPEATAHYKSLLPFRAALLDWLDARAA